jgi:hypothetical protein
MLLLGALVVDSAGAYLARQQLDDLVDDAAHDAAAGGLDPALFYRSGAVTLDPRRVARLVCAAEEAADHSDLRGVQLSVGVAGDRVTVVAAATPVEPWPVPGPAGFSGVAHARATASALTGPARGPAAPVANPRPLRCDAGATTPEGPA